MTHALTLLTEAIQRAAKVATAESSGVADTIDPTHLEKVLPQLLLDF